MQDKMGRPAVNQHNDRDHPWVDADGRGWTGIDGDRDGDARQILRAAHSTQQAKLRDPCKPTPSSTKVWTTYINCQASAQQRKYSVLLVVLAGELS